MSLALTLAGLILLALGVALSSAVHHRQTTTWFVFLARKVVGPGFMLAGAGLLVAALCAG